MNAEEAQRLLDLSDAIDKEPGVYRKQYRA